MRGLGFGVLGFWGLRARYRVSRAGLKSGLRGWEGPKGLGCILAALKPEALNPVLGVENIGRGFWCILVYLESGRDTGLYL